MVVSHDAVEDAPPFNLTDVDRAILASTDEEFHLQTWEDLKTIIANNDLHLLKRKPSDLRRYLKWSRDIKASYGSIPNYIMLKRLKWTPLPTSTPQSGPQFAVNDPLPFADKRDFKILPNDWPYGMEPGIRHIVVWLKNRLETEPGRGDMTQRSRKQIEEFVQRRFVDRVAGLEGSREKIQWFKNWTALQSVPGLEHVHVLVRDVPEEVIEEWTGGEPAVQ
ncbi:hypothetical protein GJ744_010601 [Endocarpon pusillum]|uniref:N-acetylglucosamine-induced protein 1 n=1 Tax=Endocarpon pusillum TaxID=364733 RepID=A0A8H7E991_9EURO|nr:hypothetical protein GJ744_010601 [Endocarpon pusillum]